MNHLEEKLTYYTDPQAIFERFERKLHHLSDETLDAIAFGTTRFAKRAMDILFQRRYERKFARCTDPELISVARGPSGWAQCAYDILHTRHYNWLQKVIVSRARKYHLSHEDRKDAQQNAYFAFLEALDSFDPDRAAATGCTFRTFLYQVAVARLHNFRRHLGRVERHHNRMVPLEDKQGEQAPALCKIHFTPDGHAISDGPVTDPALLAETRELRARLHAALAELDDLDRCLYETMAGGANLAEAARELGLPYQ